MARGSRPAPLNLSLVSRPRSLPTVDRPRLQSPEHKAELIRLLSPLPEDEYEDPPDPMLRAVRITVDFTHLTACLLLFSILAAFLLSYKGALSSTYGPQTALLMAALAGDVILDGVSLGRCSRTWDRWALMARTLATAMDLGVLTTFGVTGEILPQDYTLGNLSGVQAAAPVLSILCLVLAWNIVHLILSRWRVGRPWSWAWINLTDPGRGRISLAQHEHSCRGRLLGRSLRSV